MRSSCHNAVTNPNFFVFNYLADRAISRDRSSSMDSKIKIRIECAAGSLNPLSYENRHLLSTSFFTVTTVTNKYKKPNENLKIKPLHFVTAIKLHHQNTTSSHKLSQCCHKLSQTTVTTQKQPISRCTSKTSASDENLCNSVTAPISETKNRS